MEFSSLSIRSTNFINLNESDQFCLQLENIIYKWKLSLNQQHDLSRNDGCSKIDYIKCFKLSFKVRLIESDDLKTQCGYKQLLEDVLDRINRVNYIYPEETNFIQRIHGLKNYILIQTENTLDILESEHIIKLINSAISCAITNTKCIYPIFVQIKDQIFELSNGIYINFGIRINYESSIFYLDEFDVSTICDFLKIFENKLKCNLQLDDNLRCFIANRRCLNDYLLKIDQQYNFITDLTKVKEPELENSMHHLQNLRFQIKHSEYLPKIHGTQWISNFEELIPREFQKLENGCLSIQINHLEQSSIYRSSFYSQKLIKNLPKNYLQMEKDQLKNELFLYCNSDYLETKQKYLDYFLVKSELNDEFIEKNWAQFKSVPFNSIIFRFANFVFNHYLNRLDDPRNDNSIDKKIYCEISDCWDAIVDQLRRYWELCEEISCVEDKFPDFNSCLLLQKIQMLNCCIKEKQRRECSTLDQPITKSIEEDDEFFDCKTDFQEDVQAEGRLEKLKLTFSNNKIKVIYKPVTQDLAPYTEDHEDEYLKAYYGRNFNSENWENESSDQFLIGKNILLISDMEAFKAANPECCFEDFIHYYSPKDFIEAKYDKQTGQILSPETLSERFQSQNCLWRKIWQVSKAVPVCKQKRIFNYSMEAERALNFLESIKFNELMNYLFSTLVQIACSKYKKILDNSLIKSPELHTFFDQQIKKVAYKCRICDLDETSILLNNLDKKIFDHLALIYFSKHALFNKENNLQINNENFLYKRNDESSNIMNDKHSNDKELFDLMDEIVKKKFYRIKKDVKMDSIVFNGLNKIFNSNCSRKSNKITAYSKEKEFTFVADCVRPARYSRKLPQKLNFKIFSNPESSQLRVQMNGQFSEDIVYF